MSAEPCTEDHSTATGDYCGVCGLRLEPPQSALADRCVSCGAVREGRFCEVCGHDSQLPAPPEPPAAAEPEVGWAAVVRADRAWFEEVRRREGPDAGVLSFPPFGTERRFVLSGPQMAIGRRSRSRGIEPEIDLSGPPLDPGVSALHALLLARPDGSWELVDLESTNGTAVGEGSEPVPPHTPVPLADGDVVKLGAWTTITIEQIR